MFTSLPKHLFEELWWKQCCVTGVEMESSHLADRDLSCTVVTEYTSDISSLTATFGGNLRFWMTWDENLSDAICEVAARMEDSRERPR